MISHSLLQGGAQEAQLIGAKCLERSFRPVLSLATVSPSAPCTAFPRLPHSQKPLASTLPISNHNLSGHTKRSLKSKFLPFAVAGLLTGSDTPDFPKIAKERLLFTDSQ